MPHTARLRKVGGSVMLAIPPALLDALDMGPDAQVGLTVEAGRLMVEPKSRRRYTLDELLAGCDAGAEPDPGESEWTGGKPAGEELT